VNRSDYADSKSVQPGAAPGLSAIKSFKKVSDMYDNLDMILEKSVHNQGLPDDNMASLLLHNDKVSRQKIFAASREILRREISNKGFLYRFVYFSAFYHNDCICYYRSLNKMMYSYKKTAWNVLHY
jgi:hypothetical protein